MTYSRRAAVRWPQRRFAKSIFLRVAPSKSLRSSAKYLVLDYVLEFENADAHAVLPKFNHNNYRKTEDTIDQRSA